jgi:PadR family transcriptional regulator PadR
MHCMILNDTQTEAYDKIAQELRRGVLIIAVLSQLHSETHGYALLSSLADHGLSIDQGTLYPLLRRLEAQGLLRSHWNTEGSRPRRYYAMTPAGQAVLGALRRDWQELTSVIDKLFTQQEDDHGTD